MPKFNYYGPMPKDQNTSPYKKRGQVNFSLLLSKVAIYLGYKSFSHYERDAPRFAKEMKQQLFDLSPNAKHAIIDKLK